MDTTHSLSLITPPILDKVLKAPHRKTDRQRELQAKILRLKEEKNALLLAHYYQRPEVQEIADFVGDSLQLSRKAAELDADMIVFSGVYFMAETAKILNPGRRVLIPEPGCGCSLADSCPPEAFREFVEAHPDHAVVTYINCSAEIKAMSDYVCTSANAMQVIDALPVDQPVIFAPDRNLGKYLQEYSGREFLLWDGSCHVHEAFSLDKLVELYRRYPDAWIIAHPECPENILNLAHYIGSTSGLIQFASGYPQDTFIVATEVGILHEMRKAVPEARLIPAPVGSGDKSCDFAVCEHMKLNTLEKIYDCLYLEAPELRLAASIMEKAALPIQRMLNLSMGMNAVL